MDTTSEAGPSVSGVPPPPPLPYAATPNATSGGASTASSANPGTADQEDRTAGAEADAPDPTAMDVDLAEPQQEPPPAQPTQTTQAAQPPTPNYSTINADISVANVDITTWQSIFDEHGSIDARRFPGASGETKRHIHDDEDVHQQVQALLRTRTTNGSESDTFSVNASASPFSSTLAAPAVVAARPPLHERAVSMYSEHRYLSGLLSRERSVAGSTPSPELQQRAQQLVADVQDARAELIALWNDIKDLVKRILEVKEAQIESEQRERKLQADARKQKQLEVAQARKMVLQAEMLERLGEKMQRLPPEILMLIWVHSEIPMKFQLVCKRWYGLTQDASWRAEYLANRFAPYEVIFQAIARPKIFTVELFERLIKKGMPLPRYLVQELLVNKVGQPNFTHPLSSIDTTSPDFFGPEVPNHSISWRPAARWGAGISTRSLTAVLIEASKRFGNQLELYGRESDGALHGTWYKLARAGQRGEGFSMIGISLAGNATDRRMTEEMVKLYKEHDFIPYFTDLCDERASQASALSDILACVICHEPSIAKYVSRQGWRQKESTKLAMFAWLLKNNRSKLLKLLDLGLPEWSLPVTFAAREFLGIMPGRWQLSRRDVAISFPESRFNDFKLQRFSREQEWELLLELNKEHRLAFDLTALAEKFFRFSDAFGCNWTRYAFVRRLVQDLPDANVGKGTTLLEAVFFGLDMGQLDLTQAHELLKDRMHVTSEHMVYVLLCNWTRKAFALSYGELYVANFDEAGVLAKAMPDLMEQPYKGKLLDALFERVSTPERKEELRTIFLEALKTKAIRDLWRIDEDRALGKIDKNPGSDLSENTRTTIGQKWQFPDRRQSFSIKQYRIGFAPTGIPGFLPLGDITPADRCKYVQDREKKAAVLGKGNCAITASVAAAAVESMFKVKGKGKGKAKAKATLDSIDAYDPEAEDVSMSMMEDESMSTAAGEDDDALEPVLDGIAASVFRREIDYHAMVTPGDNDPVNLLLNFNENEDPMQVFKTRTLDGNDSRVDPFGRSYSVMASEMEIILSCRRQNFFGIRWSDGGDFWFKAWDHFQQDPAFVCMIFSHALLNGDQDWAKRCLRGGAKLTMDHFRMILRTGRQPPAWMIANLLEEAPDFAESDDSIIFNTIDPSSPIQIDEHPWYEPGIVKEYLTEKSKRAVKTGMAAAGASGSGSGSGTAEREHCAAAAADAVETVQTEQGQHATSSGKDLAIPISINTNVATGYRDEANTDHGGGPDNGNEPNSLPCSPTSSVSYGMVDPWMVMGDSESEDYEHLADDDIALLLNEVAYQRRMASESERCVRGSRTATTTSAATDPQFATLIGNRIKTLDEAEADRRALSTWKWQHAFQILSDEVSAEYTFKRAMAKEQKDEDGKVQRTRHSDFKKWCQKFNELYKSEHNLFRRNIMTQKRLIMGKEATGEGLSHLEEDAFSPAAALLELPGLLAEAREKDQSRYREPQTIVEACYRNRVAFQSRHPLHRQVVGGRYSRRRHSSHQAKNAIAREFINSYTGLPHSSSTLDKYDDPNDRDYTPPVSKHAKAQKPKRLRKKSTMDMHPTERGVSPPCSDCDYPNEEGEY
ncbi:hypothetical protein K437DRAFT_257269 [Tilletiaria anomala UBC 951]|uniref:F-box domain-containing protein n=1 Tax=Tilletiaria anomala (strain ATCC 24038 / CBS 436.72 / UBC 951) TaxID=1037660 RepID=A0A066VYS5_TILAU|nr:uncharacterized protein K437DRAFT_257269 [Tilletiaria anomala UBC 951]KDN43964.1 hypothetical protein K437DRAFT_257269 [Tilletiaria anomala UBC 951]